MVRSLRAGLDQYQDPYVQAQIKKMLAQKAPSNRVQGLGHILKQGLAGFMMGEDDNQRTAAQEAYATGMATPYSPAVAYKPGVVDPGVSELDIDINPEEYEGIREPGTLDSPGVEAKEEDGPFIAAQRGLNKLEDNPYATGLSAQIGYDKANMERSLAGKLKLEQQKKKLGIGVNQPKFGNTPIWGKDSKGNDVLLQPSSAGGVRQAIIPPGIEVKRGGITKVDLNNRVAVLDANGDLIGYKSKGLKPADVPYNAAQKSRATAGGAKLGTKNAEDYAIVKTAVDQQEDIANLITHLNSSEAITGIGAEMLKNLARVKAFIGDKVARKKASDTEILDVMMGSEVFPMIKSLGIGARGMDTPAERIFMRKVLTGSLELDKATLIKMAEMRSNLARRRISNWNASIDSGELNSFYTNQNLPKNKFKIRKMVAPQANLNRKNKKLPASKIPNDLVPVGIQ